MLSDQQFFAWLDGELDEEQAERVAAMVAASPELSRRAADHRRLQDGLCEAFAPLAESAPPPPRFEPAEVIDFSSRVEARRARTGWRQRFSQPQWAAMAASLAFGLVIGSQMGGLGEGDTGPITVADGQMLAAGSLARDLDVRLASAPASDGARIGLTFRDDEGRICRSFTGAAASGLACRDSGQWQIQGLFQSDPGASADYRMASAPDARLLALIDQTMAGEPFDAERERAARERGWR